MKIEVPPGVFDGLAEDVGQEKIDELLEACKTKSICKQCAAARGDKAIMEGLEAIFEEVLESDVEAVEMKKQ